MKSSKAALAPQERSKATRVLLAVGMGAMALTPMLAQAGNGGTEFDDVWATLTDWTQGNLGRIVAGSMILVGIVSGVARQSLMAFALGIGGGMGLYNTPMIVESIMSATIPLATEVSASVAAVTNGLQ